MPVIEGLDNTGKNTLAATLVTQGARLYEFPDRSGLWGKEICEFLAGSVPYGPEVETWFLENRLDVYRVDTPKPGDVIIRSGISFLVYKWYRSGVEPTEEEYRREEKLLNGEPIIYLDTVYSCPDTKSEIYDRPDVTRHKTLDKMFKTVVEKISLEHLS